jgi:hypothetical protein
MGIKCQESTCVLFSYEPDSLQQIIEELTTLAGVIREAVSFAYTNIRIKFVGELAIQNGAECGMRRADVVW